MSTKSRVLEYLEGHRGVEVSGQGLADELGVSRNAVWKAVAALREDGYEIESGTNRGHRFSERNDILSAEGVRAALPVPLKGLNIVCLNEIDSTNNEAKRRIASGEGAPLLIAAASQTAGRGRRGRSFASPAGGAYFTLVLDNPAGGGQAVLATMAAAVAVVRALDACCIDSGGIKWVNDIYVGGLKVCGILSEAVSDLESGLVANVVVGIGINLDSASIPDELAGRAGAVSLRSGIDKNRLIAETVAAFLSIDPLCCGDEGRRALVEEYRARSIIIGRPIEYEESGEMLPGVARAIDDDGALVVELPDGAFKTLHGGEVTIRLG